MDSYKVGHFFETRCTTAILHYLAVGSLVANIQLQ